MANPVKIIELSKNDWLKGLSIQFKMPTGGLFAQASNYDPFKRIGVYTPTAVATNISGVSDQIEFFIGTVESGIGYIYGFADNTKLYKIRTSNTSVSDVSSTAKQFTSISGVANHKSKIVYASATTIYAAAIPPVAATTISLFTPGVILAGDHIMKTGPDRNLYITNKNNVARVTNVTGTTGNSATYLTFEDDVIIRDIESDGRYLIILGDNNTNTIQNLTGNFRCFVAFWNMKSQDLTQIWEFTESQGVGLKFIEDEVLVVTSGSYYTCNVDTPIKLLVSAVGDSNITTFENLRPPASTRGITKRDTNTVLIACGGSADGSKVVGYGRSHSSLSKVLFQPYKIGTAIISGLYYDGIDFWAGDSNNKLFKVPPYGAPGNTSVLQLSDIDFKNPYSFSFAKVVLERPMTAATQSVTLGIKTANGNRTILNKSTFDYTTFKTTISHIFFPQALGTIADSVTLEDGTDIIITNALAAIRRVEIWGIPERPDQGAY